MSSASSSLAAGIIFFIKGDIHMKGMTGIYRINPALFGGIMALFVELIVTMLLPL